MKLALPLLGAAVCGVAGYHIGTHGDLWLGMTFLGTGLVFIVEPLLRTKPEPATPPVDTFERWRQSPHFSPKASASHRPSLRLVSTQPGASEAAPGNPGSN